MFKPVKSLINVIQLSPAGIQGVCITLYAAVFTPRQGAACIGNITQHDGGLQTRGIYIKMENLFQPRIRNEKHKEKLFSFT